MTTTNLTKKRRQKLCPECGEFFVTLSRVTGWCATCTKSIEDNSPTCGSCGRLKDSKLGCTYCKLEKYLRINADHLEYYMVQGISLDKALTLLSRAVAPTCASCGASMKQARRDSVFCRKTPRCLQAVRRYKYLSYDKGLPKATALSMVLEELNGSTDE